MDRGRSGPGEVDEVVAELRRVGCVAAEEEAAELVAAAAGDRARLRAWVRRRGRGEPLAWLVGSVTFCGERVRVDPGVYVPRWQTEPMACAAARRLPAGGVAVDLCTGAGALAVVLARRRPSARVVATDIDPRAAACARGNGVEVFEGDLAKPLPPGLRGRVDVVTAVVPYVPTEALHLLPRDVTAWEPRRALDGGPGGTALLTAVVEQVADLLRPGGWLFLELGGEQADLLRGPLDRSGFAPIELLVDAEGDTRAVSARRARR